MGKNRTGFARVGQLASRWVDQVARAALWMCVLPLLRLRARRQIGRLLPGEVTIVTVNWNSWPYLDVLLKTVRRRSPANTRVLVVDNHSRDETRRQLAGRPGVRTIKLPINMGHDFALDVGFLLADTEFVVALDVDAFPLHDAWLEELLAGLSAGNEISGAWVKRDYVHPCCLAMRTARFVQRGHTFRSHYQAGGAGREASGDVGEELSAREAGRLHYFHPTSVRGPGPVGTVFGDLVYHNFYSTRFDGTTATILDGEVAPDDASRAWQESLDRFGV